MKKKKERFIDLVDGFIFDSITKLLWHLNTESMKWNEGLEYANNLKDYGLKWRVPAIRDLINIINYKNDAPASKLPYMSSSFYWSSSTHVTTSDYAWLVNFYYGNVGAYNKTNAYSVRCVSGPFKSSKECKSIILKKR